MDYEIQITKEDKYILVHFSGEDSYDASLDLWKQVARACEEYKCWNILGIGETSKPLGTLAAYNHIKIFDEAGITLKHRIAWVEKNPEAEKIVKFAETVLRNRGKVNGYLFSDINKAKQWLLG